MAGKGCKEKVRRAVSTTEPNAVALNKKRANLQFPEREKYGSRTTLSFQALLCVLQKAKVSCGPSSSHLPYVTFHES